MIEFLQMVFETIIQALLAVMLGVFGFAYEAPAEEEEETLVALMSTPQMVMPRLAPVSVMLRTDSQDCANVKGNLLTVPTTMPQARFEPISS